MPTAYRQPSWNAILAGPAAHRRRVARGWTTGGVILMVVGALLLSSPLLAMLVITYDPGTQVVSSGGQDTAMLARAARYDEKLLSDGGSAAVGEAANPFSGTDEPAWKSDRDYLGQLGAGDAMARIRIPGIGIDLPIGHGTSAGTLEQGAGHIHGTTLPVGDPGNSVVAAHRGLDVRLLFYRVGELKKGDMVYTDAGGRTVAWQVDRLWTVDPGSKAERRALRGDGAHTLLTLYTCDPPGLNTRRLIVRAHRVPYDDDARAAERQVDVKGILLPFAVLTVLTLLLMAALHPTVPIMRHASGTVTGTHRS